MTHLRTLSASTVVVRSAELVHAEIDSEIVALSVTRGTCYGLNRVGSRIWSLLERPTRVSDICATLVAEYDVERTICEREVLDLLEELRAEGLIDNAEEL